MPAAARRCRDARTPRLARSVIADCALYRDGRRTGDAGDVAAAAAACRDGTIAWIGLVAPTREEFATVTASFDIPPKVAADAVRPHQRTKLERAHGQTYCVLRTAVYHDDSETVEFGEVQVFAAPGFLVTVRHGDGLDLAALRADLETRPEVLCRGTGAILHAIVERAVDAYDPVVDGLENDVDEVEDDVFAADRASAPSRRIYELTREAIGVVRATTPLLEVIDALGRDADEEAARGLRRMRDRAARHQETAGNLRELLRDILSVNLTLETKALTEASNRQNEEVKKISAWAAILFTPSVVAGVYGMNFDHMPELAWRFGYPMSVVLMVLVAVGLHRFFRVRAWL